MYHIDNTLTLIAPEHRLPIVYDSPHSGLFVPKECDADINRADIKAAADGFVDLLFADSPKYHGYFLKALVSRIYIDLNRACDDLTASQICDNDESLVLMPSAKSEAGHGLIWQRLPNGREITQTLDRAEVTHRIDNYWQPYHRTLERLYRRLHQEFGHVIHLNCHSMPAPAVPEGGGDIVLGDSHGSTASPHLKHLLLEAFQTQGLKCRVNSPYSGAFLIQNYADPEHGKHAVQIEINRALYMDEDKMILTADFAALKNALGAVMAAVADYSRQELSKNDDRLPRRAAE